MHRDLRLFERDGFLSPEAADNVREFSVDAIAAVEADVRAGLQRLRRSRFRASGIAP